MWCEEILKADFDFPHKDFISISKLVTSYGLSWGQTRKTCIRLLELENTIVLAKSPKEPISKIHTLLLYSDSSGYDSLKSLGERDLEVTFNPVDWDKICSGVFSEMSLNL